MPGPQRTSSVPAPQIDPQIFLDPLGYLRTELYRQRVACNTLEALASAGTNGDTRADAERVLRYVVEDQPIHTADLEECLFPVLAQRVLPEDGFDDVLAQLRGEDRRAPEMLDSLVTILRRVAEGEALPAELLHAARTVIEPRRRNLDRQTEVILPLAERRLTGADLAALGEAMARRRGVPPPK